MRITIVTGPWLPVPAVLGGSVPRMWAGLAREFATRGHDVSVLARSYPGQAKDEVVEGVRYRRRGGFSQSGIIVIDLAKDFIYAADLIAHLPEADLLVANDFWLPMLVKWARRDCGHLIVSANRFPKGQYRLYGTARRFVAASQAIARAIVAEVPRRAADVCCIPNPFDTAVFSSSKSSRAEGRERVILYVGRIHPEKGLDLLLRAFRMVFEQGGGSRLRLVGPVEQTQGGGGDRYLKELELLAAGLPVEFLAPEFEITRLARIYQSADLFCYPSVAEKGEALGVAPLEAMGAGLPVIVSSLECFLDFVREGETGMRFDHRAANPANELATTLKRALANWEETRRLGARGQQSVQRFGFGPVAGEFLDEFTRILGWP